MWLQSVAVCWNKHGVYAKLYLMASAPCSCSVSVSGVGAQGDPCTATIFDLLCFPILYSAHSPMPLTKFSILHSGILSQSLGVMKCFPKRRNLNSAKATLAQRLCEAVFCLYMAPPTNRTVSLKRWPFKWQCPVNRPASCLAWDLFRSCKWVQWTPVWSRIALPTPQTSLCAKLSKPLHTAKSLTVLLLCVACEALWRFCFSLIMPFNRR
jgi:hypothetical protein